MAKARKNPAAVAMAKLRAASMSGEERRESARKAGLVGGKARAKALTKEQRQEIARKAAAARWGKKKN
jgi:general stress protein YciG